MTETDSHLLEASLPAVEHVQLSLPILGDKPVITYRAAGDEHAPAIMLLHGMGSSSAGYRAQLAALSKNHRVIAWDAPGYGQSSPFAISSPAATDYADVLADLMSALGISRATVVGSSWGSVIAATFAAGYPSATRALVLSAPNVARGHLSGVERDVAREVLMRSAAAHSTEARAAVVNALLAPNTGPLVRAVVSRLRDAVTPTGWEHAVEMLFSTYTPSVVPSIQPPISVIVGNLDRLAPIDDHARPIHEVAQDSTLHVLDAIGHMPKLEAPGAFNSIVLAAAAAGTD
ncbi:alpha/beta fold hydrolase [Caballeronia sp. SEWSISQ10-4 2]|uniref:alpha/beta fold hydrolase n=1 Tax=Caballeronia sp. SEWSISQ10-4 2 TaxID=2937438 RepID=UPI0026549EDC|nr:alpha/beta fold hydrolase [Caballeronia sp. SEWSISQ10-4 2]MDN7179519.1 alpha/beta fold hydrolase [Caballeronia sp. SEWSISQ10-4 2]